MKLWHVIQWGNSKEGGNGYDTQCIVAASDMKAAIAKGEEYIGYFAPGYRGELADVITLLGDDGRPDEDARLVIRVWVAFGDNMGHYESWHRHPETNEWLDYKTMYGD